MGGKPCSSGNRRAESGDKLVVSGAGRPAFDELIVVTCNVADPDKSQASGVVAAPVAAP